MSQVGVFNTADFRRIEALPMRPLEWSNEDLDAAVNALTEEFKTPQGTMRLKRIQARALAEAMLHDKLVGEIGAGMGKFGLSALLFTAWKAQRGLLLVPAHLRQQTIDEWAKWSKHWKLLPLFELDAAAVAGQHVRVLSYQSLSTVRFAAFLDEYQPDVVIADEAHFLARTKSARGKRIFRYLRAGKKSGNRIRFVPLSGTMRRKSIRECSTIYEAALWEESPFPTEYPDVEQWCLALDEGIREDARIAPGVLERFCTLDETTQGIDGVRSGVRRRLVSSPGVIATSESAIDVPLVFQIREIEVPEKIKEAMRRIRTLYELPTGEKFEGGITAWNHAREVASGFCYRWDPPAPAAWRNARSKWIEFVQKAMDHPPKGMHLDSPLQVWNAVLAGKFGDPERVSAWREWKDIRDTFEPNPVPVWLDDFLVRDAEEWALKTGGIVWVGHTSAFTKQEGTGLIDGDEDAIGRLFTKIPYFGAGKAGEQIKTYKGPCVASVRAHGTGKNLVQWNRALWMCMPSSGSAVEQLAARHHRLGQESDEVMIDVYLHSRELFQALITAQKDARFMESLNGNPQRITSSVILAADGHAFDPGPYEDRIERATSADDPMWSQNAKAK